VNKRAIVVLSSLVKEHPRLFSAAHVPVLRELAGLHGEMPMLLERLAERRSDLAAFIRAPIP